VDSSVYFAINGKSWAGTILLCIHICPDSKYSIEFVLLITRWTQSSC